MSAKKRTKAKRKDEQMTAVTPLALARKEVARALSLSVRSVDRAIKRGDLHAKRHGSRVLVPRSEIDRYLDKLKDAASLDEEKPPTA